MSDHDSDLNTDDSFEFSDDVAEVVEQPQQEPQESEDAPVEQGKDEEKPKSTYVDFDDAVPDPDKRQRVKERVAELYRNSKKAEKLEAELEKANARLKELENPVKELTMPEVDLAFENPEEFKRKSEEYAHYLAEKKQRDDQAKAEGERVKALEQERFNSRVATFDSRSKELGIAPKVMEEAIASVVDAGMAQFVTDNLLDDPNGPAVVHYLKDKFDVLHELSQMNDYQRAMYIERNIMPKITQPRKQSPAPATKVNGFRSSESGGQDYTFE